MIDFPQRARALFCSGVLLAQPFALWAADANSAASYALRLPITLSAQTPDAPLQRLLLPARALVSLQSAAYGDVRIFNAQGQPVPMALSAAAPAQAERQQVDLPAYPILGAADFVAGNLEGMSLRIEERQGRRVVQINTGTTTGTAAAGPGTAQKTVGALIDARAIDRPVVAVQLDADIPPGQPVTFRLQASRDLKSWRQLSDTVLFRSEASAGSLGNAGFELRSADLKDNYLRLTWSDATGAIAGATGVIVRSATLLTSTQPAGPARVNAGLATPALTSPHELSFTLPFATQVAALHIVPKGDNVLIPLRVLGRNANGQPWTVLTSTVVYRLGAAGGLQGNGAVNLPSSSFREIKLEADKKTPGFAAAPDIILQFDPVQIVFLASGPGPYTLAAGLAQTASAYLPLQSLMPGYKVGQENALPLASFANVAAAEAGKSSPALVNASPATDSTPTRSLVLWGILLAGVAALGLMAWVLLKQGTHRNKEAAPPQS